MAVHYAQRQSEITTRWQFVFDTNKCVGCHACVVACNIENGESQELPWREITSYNHINHPQLPVFHHTLACNHCDDAPCLSNCPANAYTKDPDTGAVIHHAQKCIGCRYCTWACPYDAPKYNTQKGIIEKCTFCNSRINQSLTPACVNLCPTGALNFSQKVQNYNYYDTPTFINRNIGPSIKIIPYKENKQELITVHPLQHKPEIAALPPKISLLHEWPLIAFTYLISWLIAWFAASLTNDLAINTWTYSGILSIAGILSLFHLGQKTRAWRAVSNIKNSWLSREIAFFGGFAALSLTSLWLLPHPAIGYLAVLFGILCLISVDMLYRIADRSYPGYHSGGALLVGLFLFAFLADDLVAFTILFLIKAGLYLHRHLQPHTNKHKIHWLVPVVRVALGFILPVVLIFVNPPQLFAIIFALIFVAEFIDRIELYLNLSIITPNQQIRNVFRRKLLTKN